MKHHVRRLVGLVILSVAFLAAVYTQRVRVSDLIGEATAPDLPAAVTYEEAARSPGSAGAEVPVPTAEDTEGTPSSALADDPAVGPVPASAPEEEASSVVEQAPAPVEVPAEAAIPASFNLAAPFTSQAPFANWDAVHEETCEEAAVYMVVAYYRGVAGQIPPQTAEDELQGLVALENEMFGFYQDTTALQTAYLAEKMYGNSAQVETDPTVESIKAHVAAGRPVIVPTAGRLLRNPNFSGDGPPYHMIVIRGYTETSFVTNDPGTRRGEEYVYDIGTVMNAMHDWTGSYETIESGPKAILVIYP